MSNNDKIEHELLKIQQWQKDHERHDEVRFAKLATKDEMEEIVKRVLIETLFSAGKITKMTLITVASLIAALAVISGAGKWLLGVIGIGFLPK